MKRSRSRPLKRRYPPRRGIFVVGILACMVVCSALVAVALQTALRGRREARLAHQMIQVQLLCEAGVKRAVERLATDQHYTGETWQPDLQLSTYTDASVEIEALPLDEGQSAVNVRVTGRLTPVTHSFGPLQRTHKFQYTISTK